MPTCDQCGKTITREFKLADGKYVCSGCLYGEYLNKDAEIADLNQAWEDINDVVDNQHEEIARLKALVESLSLDRLIFKNERDSVRELLARFISLYSAIWKVKPPKNISNNCSSIVWYKFCLLKDVNYHFVILVKQLLGEKEETRDE